MIPRSIFTIPIYCAPQRLTSMGSFNEFLQAAIQMDLPNRGSGRRWKEKVSGGGENCFLFPLLAPNCIFWQWQNPSSIRGPVRGPPPPWLQFSHWTPEMLFLLFTLMVVAMTLPIAISFRVKGMPLSPLTQPTPLKIISSLKCLKPSESDWFLPDLRIQTLNVQDQQFPLPLWAPKHNGYSSSKVIPSQDLALLRQKWHHLNRSVRIPER